MSGAATGMTVLTATGVSDRWQSEVDSGIDCKPRPRPPLPAAGSQGADGLPGPTPTPSRRDSDHHREVQQLYEEMEQQIRQEKLQLQAEVGSPRQPTSPPALNSPAGQAVGRPLASVGQREAAGSRSSHSPELVFLREVGWGALSLGPLLTSARSRVSPGATPSALRVSVSYCLSQGSCPRPLLVETSWTLHPRPGWR